MNSAAAPNRGAITFDQLIALNAEIAALARAGVPLESGLKEMGRDMPGRLGSAAGEIARRLEGGERLDAVLSQMGDSFPPAYRAVVEAGLRSGRLAAALEGISASSRRVAELRRSIWLALIYPLILAAIAYNLLVFILQKLTPVLLHSFDSFSPDGDRWFAFLRPVAATVELWAPWPPLIVISLLVVCWVRQRSAPAAIGGGMLARWTAAGRVMHSGRVATFADLLALMIEQGVPLVESLPLAAAASGDRSLIQGAGQMAERIARGDARPDSKPPAGIPPLLAWLLATGSQQPRLSESLRHVAEDYHQRAVAQSEWITVYLPIVLAVGVGGVAIAIEATILLGPWFKLLFDITQPF